MNILVVGHVCLDVIHPRTGPRTECYGGIYYAVVAMASILEKTDFVIPVFGVNKHDYVPLIEHLRQFPNIDTSGIFKFEEPTNTVHLYYQADATRKEESSHIAAPIPYRNIRKHLSVDGILLNMVSGYDITLDTLDRIRMAVRSRATPIHFDFHSLTLGVDPDNSRFRRPVEEWRRWAFMVNIVQLNREEAGGLSLERLSEKELAGHLLTLGTRGVIVTKGEEGSTIYFNTKKVLEREDVPAETRDPVHDTTGCGDIYGAAFFVEYVRTASLVSSARYATTIAAARVGDIGSVGLAERIAGARRKSEINP